MFGFKCAISFIVTFSVITSADEMKEHDWDLLIFTQHWPPTVCMEWTESNPSHSCALPSQRDAWTIHGVWPTKIGTIGPQFCDHTKKFNMSALAPIEKQLEQSWINIEKDTPLDGLWKHEWEKHGTCAMILDSLNTETKYFSQGLHWLQGYSMSDILLGGGIKPGQSMSYSGKDVYITVKNKIGRNPGIYCKVDQKTGKSYIFEIRICFDKQFNLIDCDGIVAYEYNKGKNLLHCDPTKPVIYMDSVPVTNTKSSFGWSLVEIYRFISWLHWFTL